MNRHDRDREFCAVAKLVLADAAERNVLASDGHTISCSYSTVLLESVPALVTLYSFLPPRPVGDLPPEAYLRFVLWPGEPRPRPTGKFNVAFRENRGWVLYGDQDYRRTTGRSAELARLIGRARP